METKKEHWPLLTFKECEQDINPNPTYQRSSVWRTEQKQMLIDSIIRKIDIPKIYLRELHNSDYQYEVIDGQQRMRAIWDFLKGDFALGAESSDVVIREEKYEVSEKTYGELASVVKREKIHKYNLDIVIIYNASEDEIADLFYRLNHGTPLNPAEVRNSMPGEMTARIRELSKHTIFKKVSFTGRRYAHNQVCAQMMLLELNDGLADIGDRSLSKMYSDYKKSIPKRTIEGLQSNLNILDKLFLEKSRLLNKAATINLYLLMSYLSKTVKLTDDFYNSFFDWYTQTEPERRKNNEYKLYMTSSANSRNSIEGRFGILLLDFCNNFQDIGIVQLDPNRIFSESDKIEIFARDKRICQRCFKKVTERSWHADHIIPWSKGGKTALDNAQLLCIKCNLQKKDKLW